MLQPYHCNICGNIAAVNINGIWYCRGCRTAYQKYKCFQYTSLYQARITRWYIRSVFRIYEP